MPIKTLAGVLPPRQVITDPFELVTYEADGGIERGSPDGVVLPQSPEDAMRVARWSAEHNVPLIARGAGTGLSGGAIADRGGVIVSFSRMNHLLELDVKGRSAVVEPGILNLALDDLVKKHNLYYPPDPASQRASTLGGNVGENAGGPHCFKYGVTTNYVIGVRLVLPGGRVVELGGRALDYPEYDFVGLVVGSEGTLGLITSVDVRLVQNPPGVKTMMAAFGSLEQAGKAVSAVIAAGLMPATMEMMDHNIARIVEEYAQPGLPMDAEAILIIEADGYPASLDTQIEEVADILQAHGGRGLRIAQSAEERDRIWFARKSAAGAFTRFAPAYYLVDITVPRSRLAETLAEVNQICERYGVHAGHVFHAGDGNLHPLIAIMHPEDPAQVENAQRAGQEMVKTGVRHEGSLSGEHGVGTEKREYMPMMYSGAELAAMWDVKQVFDPRELCNPGKVFPAQLPAALHASPDGALPSSPFIPTSAEEAAQGLAALSRAGRRVHIGSTASSQDQGSAVQGSRRFAQPTSPPAPLPARDRGIFDLQGAGSIHSPSLAGRRSSEPSGEEKGPEVRSDDLSVDSAAALRTVSLSTAGLSGIKTYSPDDLYVTVGAGTPLEEIQAFLARERRQIPVASPWQGATIGGIVASNMNAPLRMRYGSIRDLVMALTVALADGRVIRAGRPVVKNVAGYDMPKVFIGSYGTLGLIADVTLKLIPLPRVRRTLLAPVDDFACALTWAGQLVPLAFVASGIVVAKNKNSNSYVLTYTAEGIPEDVEAELARVREVLGGAGWNEAEQSATDLWCELLRDTDQTVQVRAGIPPKDVAAYTLGQAAALQAGAFLVDIANGLVYASMPTDRAPDARAWVNALRQPALQAGGYAVVLNAPPSQRAGLDPWGYRPESLDRMRALKARWDPAGILNPGEFVV